jgi:hypothetical protein
MSEQQKEVNQPKNDAQEVEVKETKVEASPQFTQEDLDRIIKQRLEAEKAKNQRALDEIKVKEQEALKEKEIKEAKTKADLENLMKSRITEKDVEIKKMQDMIKKEKVDNSILSVASKNKAINPSQVVQLIKNKVRYTDDNRIEILDNNNNIRYNSKGELLTIEESVNEFLDANPHFRQGSLAGSGSQSALEGKTVKPFNLQDLNFDNPEDKKRYAEYRKQRDSGPIKINLNNKQ